MMKSCICADANPRQWQHRRSTRHRERRLSSRRRRRGGHGPSSGRMPGAVLSPRGRTQVLWYPAPSNSQQPMVLESLQLALMDSRTASHMLTRRGLTCRPKTADAKRAPAAALKSGGGGSPAPTPKKQEPKPIPGAQKKKAWWERPETQEARHVLPCIRTRRACGRNRWGVADDTCSTSTHPRRLRPNRSAPPSPLGPGNGHPKLGPREQSITRYRGAKADRDFQDMAGPGCCTPPRSVHGVADPQALYLC